VLALWRRYVDLERASDRAYRPAAALHAALVARYGKGGAQTSVADLWGHDPDFPELERLNEESDRLNELQMEAGDTIAATPATSLAGLRAKVRLAMSLWPTGSLLEYTDYHEDFALAVLRDADRLLAIHGETVA
jgi:hypothetical protein